MSLSPHRDDRLKCLERIAANTALVLETNNLRGGSDAVAALNSLERLIARLARQSVPAPAFAQWVITHDGLDLQARQALCTLAGRALDFVEIDARTGYYDAKNVGFDCVDQARCEYVVFADADCIPCAQWLEQLLAPFAQADAPVAVAGRTSYAPSVTGSALTAIDFMYFPSPLRHGATRNFYANNVAFRCDTFEQYRYEPLDGVYRAHCQVMGLRLQAAGVAVAYAPGAHTEHRLPDSHGEVVKLRWLRGGDSVDLTPYLVRAYMPGWLQWLGRSGPLGPLCVMVGRLGYSLRALNHQDLPPLRGLRRLGATAIVIGMSLLDTAGAVVRGCGLSVGRSSARHSEALSYHRNLD
ncbi:glycosyltransferase [Pseudomonas sp. Fl5BN2]|uniref:glycosyltransferase n=1 Tax=unclassified Pseudomonas TaxID=196821 RepID=UPI0013767425|nr:MULTISPECIES: glycosyltransferase family 2 protein [unclassified Pseudomonas]NBF04104.1 glycosyltransferase [Pseudomonas sp. Fl5BN2]NBF09649.1 glycosyltransferase [Pseudomonas sp. Fl4BN1]